MGVGVGYSTSLLSHTRWWIGLTPRTKPTWRAPSFSFVCSGWAWACRGHMEIGKIVCWAGVFALPSLYRPSLHFLDQYPGPVAIPCACRGLTFSSERVTYSINRDTIPLLRRF